MKIISIDVGIKNLSFCLFEHSINKFSIIKWDVINLLEKDTSVCCIANCKNEPKYIKQENIYCSKHGKKTEFLIPTKELNSSFLKKQKIENLFIIADKLCMENTKALKKKELLGVLLEFLENHCMDSIYISKVQWMMIKKSKNIIKL